MCSYKEVEVVVRLVEGMDRVREILWLRVNSRKLPPPLRELIIVTVRAYILLGI